MFSFFRFNPNLIGLFLLFVYLVCLVVKKICFDLWLKKIESSRLTDVHNYNIIRRMNSKLTLRLNDKLISVAKTEAAQRGKSVSQMVGEFIDLLQNKKTSTQSLPPVTSSIRGILKESSLTEEDYKKHVQEKYL